ncbi:MAG: hypothetical protein ABUL44_02380, partial [Flavobacterium sp.]
WLPVAPWSENKNLRPPGKQASFSQFVFSKGFIRLIRGCRLTGQKNNRSGLRGIAWFVNVTCILLLNAVAEPLYSRGNWLLINRAVWNCLNFAAVEKSGFYNGG